MLLLTQLTTESGFLRHDGALVLGVEVEELTAAAAAAAGGDGGTITEHAYPATLPDGTTSPGTSGAAASELGSDLLALLDHPGPTTDFTVIATADAPAAGGGGGTAAAEAKAADGAAAGDGDSMNSSRRFEVHRAILAARCPYFATLFDSGMDDSGARELTLPDTDPDALAALLRYIYGGSLTVTCREHARSCLQLADRLLLPKAAAMLRRHLLSTLSVSTVMPDLLWAVSAAPNDEELLTAAVDFAAAAEPDLPEQWLEQLAEAAPPALVARLFTACRRAARRVVT
ncbi:hypothetical protein HYH02_007439 [Chlamydomonas schloesseri]|uniref:BTB domain-containing protein n=1 Tax=Chlamydomonas schloesseri TaxID=2026947 RepID=A0A836B4N9_9CHLO|nr:hypothetical protein HYH02_007439 [Chlamydomonas schloesseri]|eukprot:KAG2447515.1 hypothetical protein HYH02_007439 [Chlamydomonas schloesseri]